MPIASSVYSKFDFPAHHEFPIPSLILDQVIKLRLSAPAKGSIFMKFTRLMVNIPEVEPSAVERSLNFLLDLVS